MMAVLARLLPLALVCKHVHSPDQIHRLSASDGDALFSFEHAIPGNFLLVCGATKHGKARLVQWRSVCF